MRAPTALRNLYYREPGTSAISGSLPLATAAGPGANAVPNEPTRRACIVWSAPFAIAIRRASAPSWSPPPRCWR